MMKIKKDSTPTPLTPGQQRRIKNYLERKASQARDRARALTTDPDFLVKARDARKLLRIPPDGLTPGSQVQKWQAQVLFQDSGLMAALTDRVRALAADFGLGEHWLSGLKNFIITNQEELLRPESDVAVSTQPFNELGRISVREQRDTTSQDRLAMEPFVGQFKRRMPENVPLKHQPRPTADKSSRAAELHRAGMSYTKIADLFTMEYPDPEAYDSDRIKKMVRRHSAQTRRRPGT